MWRGVTRGRIIGAALLAAAAFVAPPAGANTRSQQLYAKALLPFHAQRWQEAQRLLNEAAAADPNDAVVAYYQGLANARLGNSQLAITDLERALSVRPDLQGAVLDLGILYFESGQYQPALEWLQRAYKRSANRFSAAFFLGLTHLRMGDAKGAQPLFAEAGKDPELRPAAQYYEALALLREGERSDARALFSDVQAGPADAETTRIARQYLSAPAAAAPGTEEAEWEVHGDAGFGYDSNVVLAPNSSSLKRDYTANPNYPACPKAGQGNCPPTIGLNTDGEQDGFFRVSAGGKYRLFAVDSGSGVIGYDFYQSAHFTSSAYDLQNHRIQLTLSTAPISQLVQVGVTGVYDFYLLDYRGFYQQGRGTPWVTVYEGLVGATQGYYSLVGQDYLNGLDPNSASYSPAQFNNDPFNPFADAINNAVGIRQYFLLGAADRSMSIGYQWDDNDPLSNNAGTDFAYQDNAFDAQVDLRLFDWWYGTLGYLFDLQDYEHPNSRTDFGKRRHDAQNQVVVDFRFPLPQPVTPKISPRLTYLGVFNHSNIPDFEYDRNIVQAGVWLQF